MTPSELDTLFSKLAETEDSVDLIEVPLEAVENHFDGHDALPNAAMEEALEAAMSIAKTNGEYWLVIRITK